MKSSKTTSKKLNVRNIHFAPIFRKKLLFKYVYLAIYINLDIKKINLFMEYINLQNKNPL